MKTCTSCGNESYKAESKFCLKCGASLENAPSSAPDQNRCTNPDCQSYKGGWNYPDDARFCDACGSKSSYNN